jgi:hypothetical protein
MGPLLKLGNDFLQEKSELQAKKIKITDEM